MSRWTASLLVALVFVALIGMGLWHIRKNLPSPQEWTQLLEKELSHALGVPVQLEVASVRLTGAVVRQLRIQPDPRSPTGYFLTIPEVRLRWALRDLLRPSRWRQLLRAQVEQVLHHIVVANATVFLWRNQTGNWNVPFLTARAPARRPIRLPNITIRNSVFILGDETLPLPDGTPFQLRLVAVEGTVQPINGGTRLDLFGQLSEPLGSPESRAALTIVQVSVGEGEPQTHGRLLLSHLQLNALPAQWRAFDRWQLRGGSLRNIVVHWQQEGKEVSLSATARVHNALVRHPKGSFAPLHALLRFAASLNGNKVRSWQVVVRTLQPHPQLGSSMAMAEGQRHRWQVRWRGERLPVNTLRLFVPDPLPLQQGMLSGTVMVEAVRNRWLIDAQLTAQRTQVQLPSSWQERWQMPTVPLTLLNSYARLERAGKRWQGRVDLAAHSPVGQGQASVWLNGREGRARVQVRNLSLAPFRTTLQKSLPEQMRFVVRLRDGSLSGAFVVAWQGRRWRLEELSGVVKDVGLDTAYGTFVRLSAQVRSDGRSAQLSSLQVHLDRTLVADFSGRTTIERTPLWEVQGRITPRSLPPLNEWLVRQFGLPAALLGVQRLTVHSGGIGQQWQGHLVADAPVGLFSMQGARWHWAAGRLTLFAAPQGGAVVLNAATLSPAVSSVRLGKEEGHLTEGLRMSEWRFVWDAQRRLLTAYGSVTIPQGRWRNALFRNAHADVEGRVILSDQPAWEVFVRNFSAITAGGKVKDGHLHWHAIKNGEQNLTARLSVRDMDIAEWQRILSETPSESIRLAGKFSGTLTAQTDTRKTLQLALSGELSEGTLRTEAMRIAVQKVSLPTLLLAFRSNGKPLEGASPDAPKLWQLSTIAGEARGQKVHAFDGVREWLAQSCHLQGIAERHANGWSWDIRVPKVLALGGEGSGQGQGTLSSGNGRIQFARLDIGQLAKWLGELGGQGSGTGDWGKGLPKGFGSGWLQWTAVKRNGKWQGQWEAASLLIESQWQDWTVKLAGARARGEWQFDEQRKLLDLTGTMEGVHLLSDEGQAVLNGTFTFRQGRPQLDLQGRWTGLSLSRLSQRLKLPLAVKGLAEGTMRLQWDGQWRLQATALAQAVGIGKNTLLRNLEGNLEWQGNEVRLRSIRALWGDGTMRAEGVVRFASAPSVNLTVSAEKLSLTEIATLLQEWSLPLSDWSWRGQVKGTAQVLGAGNEWQAHLALDGEQVRLGDAPLGTVRLDLTVTHQQKEEKPLTTLKGQVTAHHHGTAVTVAWEGQSPEWQVRWQGGAVPLDTLKALVAEGLHRHRLDKAKEWEQWLRLPLFGTLSSEGTAVVHNGTLATVNASVRLPALQGLGPQPTQVSLKVQRAEQKWLVHLTELRQGYAQGEGLLTIADDGRLSGTFALTRVPSELVAKVAALVIKEAEQLPIPDGTITARVQLAGTTERPIMEGTVRADNVYWRGWTVRQIAVRRFLIRDGALEVEQGDGLIRWLSDASLASFWGSVALNGERKWQWQLELPPTPLEEVLPPDLPVHIERGWIGGSLRLHGSWAEPKVDGTIELGADAVSFLAQSSVPDPYALLSTLHNVRCQLMADGKTVRLTKLTANWSGGTVTGEGWLQLKEGGLQNLLANEGEWQLQVRNAKAAWDNTALQVQEAFLRGRIAPEGLQLSVERWQGNGLEVFGGVRWAQIPVERWAWLSDGQWNMTVRLRDFRWQVKGAKGKLSGTVSLRTEEGQKAPLLSGRLSVHDGDMLRLPVLTTRGDGRWQLPPILRIALTLEVGERFFLRNPQASLLLDGELALTGDLSLPRMEGELRSQRGTLRLPASVLTITDMGLRLAYSVDPLTRQWLGTARLRIEGETQLDIHRILFTVSGPVDEQSQRLGILPSVTLLAIPPLPERTVLERMFGLGLAQLGEALTNWQQLFSGAFVQSFMGNILAPVTEPIAQALRWTELSVIREQTTQRRWLRLGIPLSPRLHVLWRQGLSSADPSAVEVQYYLGKRTSVTVIKRERERAEVRVQTSVRF